MDRMNKKNMLELAERLDSGNPHIVTIAREMISDDLLTSMAYQLSYFFEAKEIIDSLYKGLIHIHTGEFENGLGKAVEALNSALIHKEEGNEKR